MKTASSSEVTQLLRAWGDGDQEALNKLIPLVYQELHRLASHYMRKENPNHTLQTSALVNEAYLRLVDQKKLRWQNRAHFFGEQGAKSIRESYEKELRESSSEKSKK